MTLHFDDSIDQARWSLQVETLPCGGYVVMEGRWWGMDTNSARQALFACSTLSEALVFIRHRITDGDPPTWRHGKAETDATSL